MIIVGRDLLLVGGYTLVVPRGYEFEVNFLGKLATWVLYASLGSSWSRSAGTDWPLWLFWIGVALAVAAAAFYVRKARREVRGRESGRHGRREGTRLRPLTSNQPKPMVPIVGKPCMEHILELLRDARLRRRDRHRRVPAAGDPRLLRRRRVARRARSSTRSRSRRSARPGSVRLASGKLDETFLVISGDALCDIDLTRARSRFHRERGAAVTIGLKSVDNPLEFGIVVTDEDGRVERFLEKPSWGQVFSDTINTGIYVLEPEVLRHIPTTGRTTSRRSSSRCCSRWAGRSTATSATATGRTSATSTSTGRRTSTRSTSAVRLNIPGIRLRGNIWIGEGVELDDLDAVEGPAFIGNYCRIARRGARSAPYSVLSASVTLREGARARRAR